MSKATIIPIIIIVGLCAALAFFHLAQDRDVIEGGAFAVSTTIVLTAIPIEVSRWFRLQSNTSGQFNRVLRQDPLALILETYQVDATAEQQLRIMLSDLLSSAQRRHDSPEINELLGCFQQGSRDNTSSPEFRDGSLVERALNALEESWKPH